jgi:anti-anti-sigma factor
MGFSDPVVVRLEAREWDIASADQLGELLATACEGPNVVIDMSRVEYFDSTCLGKLAVMQGKRTAKRLPPARMVICSTQVRRIFHIVQYDRLWPIFDSMESALADANGECAPSEARPPQ